MTKKELRSEYKALRNSINDRNVKSVVISDRVINSNFFEICSEIFLYYPLGSEVSTFELLKAAVKCGKRVAYPKCNDSNGNMDFYYVTAIEEMTEGMFGIFEPDPSVSEVAVPTSDSLMIVPALAFDMQGYRLGYGKGYYDRYLFNKSCKTIGIAFDDCVFAELPHNIYDCRVDCLITDKSVYFFD